MCTSHVELKILYRINDINYTIVHLSSNRSNSISIKNVAELDLPEPNYNQDLIIFLQRNENPPHQIHVGFYNDTCIDYFTQMFDFF